MMWNRHKSDIIVVNVKIMACWDVTMSIVVDKITYQ